MGWNPLEWADVPGDSPSARLGKRTVLLEALVGTASGLIASPLVYAAGFPKAALWSGLCLTVILGNLVCLRFTRRFTPFLVVNTAFMVATYLGLAVLLRGVPGIETLGAYCFSASVGAALFGKRRRALGFGILGLAAIAGIVTLHLRTPPWPAPFWFLWLLPVATLGFTMLMLSVQVLALGVGRRELSRALNAEHARSESLLLNVLPAPIAERLKADPTRIAEQFDDVTVLFGDVVGFTPLSASLTPRQLVDALDNLFSAFDDIAERHGLEKIKTIGDAYMVVGGVPTRRPDHAQAVARMALEMREVVEAQRFGERRLQMRIGIHSGPVVAGVIGKKKFSYDLWGDTVNTAARMESHGAPGEIQITDACRAALGEAFAVEERGVVDIKGKGPMRTWWLKGRKVAACAAFDQ